jgi:hypothetical protein
MKTPPYFMGPSGVCKHELTDHIFLIDERDIKGLLWVGSYAVPCLIWPELISQRSCFYFVIFQTVPLDI